VGCVGCEGCVGCVGCNEQSRPLLTFDIPQTALVATLDTYDLLQYYHTTRFQNVFFYIFELYF
jgi:hypothetical protein